MKFTEYLRYTNSSRRITESSSRKVQPKTKDELKKIIEDTIKEQGFKCDLNFIDTSLIKDMSDIFSESNFNGDISKWDVSNVKSMAGMFYKSNFNGDISEWDVSKVENMTDVFEKCPIKEEYKPKFNKNYGEWA